MSAHCHRSRGIVKPGIDVLKRCCWLTLIFTWMIALLQNVMAQSARVDLLASNAPVFFDLPVQALETAIEAFSVSSGWQVVYDASLAADRRSAVVKGRMPPATALNQLLTGTGLTIDYMTKDAAMLVPIAAARRGGALVSAAGEGSYYGHVQARLKRAICASGQTRLQAHRLAIGFWIGGTAAVTRVELLGTTGDIAIDSSFRDLLLRLSFDQTPPAGFKQPVVVLITPDLLAQCSETAALPAGEAQ